MFRFLVTMIFLFTSQAENPRPPYSGLYNHVEPGQVITEMIRFIEDKKLTNCFAQRINHDLLSLKCMVDGEIKEVVIEIVDDYEEIVVYSSVSLHSSFSESIVI